MSVIEKLENYWRGVCDPRYVNPHASSVLNGKFDRTSRRSFASFNIHSHAHQNHQAPPPPHLFVSKQQNHHSSLQRKLSTPHHQPHQQSGTNTLITNSPCRVCEERSQLKQKPPSGAIKSTNNIHPTNQRKSSSSSVVGAGVVSPNNLSPSHHHINPNNNAAAASSNNHHAAFPSNNDLTTTTTTTLGNGDFRDHHRDDILFEAIEDKKSICPDPPVNQPSQYESVKMRLQKPEGRPKSLEFSQRRAWMRLYRDMEVSDVGSSTSKLATNMTTMSPVNSSNSAKESSGKRTSKPRSKSILHLHRLDSQPDIMSSSSSSSSHHKDKDKMDTLSNASDDSSQCSSLKQSQSSSQSGGGGGGNGGSGTSLFQRFSKTFSLRFGSGSPSRKTKKVKYPVGSSPDLFHRVESENVKTTDNNSSSGWKWRQSSLSTDRDEKCRSGDSGISMLPTDNNESHLRSRSTRRTRRIQSENIDAILEAQSSSSSSDSSSNINIHHQSNSNISSNGGGGLPHMDSPISRKLSLVEIPDHVWDSENNPTTTTTINNQPQKPPEITTTTVTVPPSSSGLLNRRLSLNNNSSSHHHHHPNEIMTKSYEDLLEAKLDDDGFVSSDEHEGGGGGGGSSNSSSSNKENNNNNMIMMMTSSPNLSGHCQNNNHSSQSKGLSANHRASDSRIQSPRSKSVPRVTKIDFNSNNDGGIRGKVVSDILKTEHNYVKTLNDIVQGFLVPMRKRKDLFSMRVISNIFSNVEDILRLHARFLEALASSLNKHNLAESSVGHIFTLWTDEFDLYCDYCCNNPISMLTLQNLTTNPEYTEFFEACRRLQMMDKLPLHGFLLRPIQRICQYHLQLLELKKHTEVTHKDYESTSEALHAMKKVAQKVNDTQRKFDSLKDILEFQNSIDLFEGSHLVDRNATIVHRGDLVKAHQGRKHKEVHVAILNTELVICKRLQKDMNKKNELLFLGRVDLSHRTWYNIDSNEEDEIFGYVHNSWRIYSKEKACWILFTTMTAAEKAVWLEALDKVGLPEERVEPKMRERVKELIVEQAQAKLISSQSQNHHNNNNHHLTQSSYQNNTLPKSKKSAKQAKQAAAAGGGGAVSSDAMLIEVGKLKRSSFTGNSHSSTTSTSQKDRTSTFYV